jgi:translocation and assembly module TamB
MDPLDQAKAKVQRARSRLRRFFLRHVPLAMGSLFLLSVVVVVGLYLFASSEGFQNRVRRRLEADLSAATGGRVEIASFHWQLLKLEAEAEGVVIHGTEAADEAPYARIDKLQVHISVLGLISPDVRLRDLEIEKPALHLIVYSDGATNQPRPHTKQSSKPVLDQFFDLKAGHINISEGVLDYDNRAARFDVQRRMIPLDFAADDLSMRLSYVGGGLGQRAPEHYHVELGAKDLKLARGSGKAREPEVHGQMQATLDLMRSSATLTQLKVSSGSGRNEHVLEVSGTLDDFTHPRWQAKGQGELDMALIEPATGYPSSPEGIARLSLIGKGAAGRFAVDGSAHVDGGSYIGTGVTARGITLDARVHADEGRLLIDNVVARFKSGGQMEGTVDLRHWILPSADEPKLAASVMKATHQEAERRSTPSGPVIVQAPRQTIPVDGKVTAKFENLSLDTLLDMVSQPPFQRLGMDALLNGNADAAWQKGDNDTVMVSTRLMLSPAGRGQGELPTHGNIDAVYSQKDGTVELHQLQLSLPQSTVEASGRLGAYPMTGATSLTLNFHSQRLEEFDTVLRDLRLERAGRAGAEALPIKLAGQAEFSGTWTGSLLAPRIGGNLKATQVALEMPSRENEAARFVNFDEIDATGGYSPERISVDHAILSRGAARLTVNGTLDAAEAVTSGGDVRALPGRRIQIRGTQLTYNRNAVLQGKVQATKIGIEDLQPFFPDQLPATGTIDAALEVHGPLGNVSGSGNADLVNGSLYDQPMSRLHVQGELESTLLKFTALNMSTAGGTIAGSGSYDYHAKQFNLKAQGSTLEIAQFTWLKNQGTSVTGKAMVTLSGSGSTDDPRVDGHATVSRLTIGGEALGSLEATAHTENHALRYDVQTVLAGAELNLHGQTELHGDYNSTDQLTFTKFDVGALLKLAHVEGLNGQSALAGNVTIAGPLKKLDELHGEARLQELAVTLEGVHLASEGGAHATLEGGRIHLDPMHVTGESTDLRAQGTLALTGDKRLDIAANGSINLKLAETLDPDLTASGTTTFQIEAHGTMQNPGLRGRVDVENGMLSLEDLPNGLSQLKGTLEFNQNRLEVRSLTAMTGGGQLSVGGSLTYQHGLYADLTVTGKGVRIRYPEGVSSLADATLQLQGPETNLLLSGNMLITRFAMSPDLDLAALAAQATSKVEAVAPPNAPSNHVRLDVHLVSSPQLSFQNAFAKLAGDVDLRLRGTLASPSLLGRVSITEGNAVIAGTQYELERGDITLTNPVRIEPIIDLTATAHVEDYDITLGLHGSLEKMNVSYRSDPPLPESDVVSLLALGHTQDQERLYTQQQEQQFSNSSTDALLGGALNATVSSRVQKLFGAGSVKVDPVYLGAFGNSTSRVTVQEQLGKILTLTYATDVNTTGQQLLQAEVAINKHVSLVVARDESGVFSMVVKASRRYK